MKVPSILQFEWSDSNIFKKIVLGYSIFLFLNPLFFLTLLISAVANYDGKIFNKRTQTFMYLFGLVFLGSVIVVGIYELII